MRFDDVVAGLKSERREPICAYVYDLAALAAWAGALAASLPRRCQLYYAVKANAEAPILAALAGRVAGFEVASLGEMRKVLAASPGAAVIFGGPGKTDEELAGAAVSGVRFVHVESLHELRRLELIGARAGRRISVLLRVNLAGPLPLATLSMAGRPTQFGIDEAELPAALALAARCPHLDLQGFHLHSLSNQLDARAHVELLALYLSRWRAWQALAGIALPVLNVGGGLGVAYEGNSRFDWPGFCAKLAERLAAAPELPGEIIFECGRYLAADSGVYAAEVLDLKCNHGKTFVVVRGGTHHFRLPASWQHSHPFHILAADAWPYPFERPSVVDAEVTVVGQLCTPKDVLARDVRVARVRVGDVLVFEKAGAYGWSISHHDFLSHPHPEMIYVA